MLVWVSASYKQADEKEKTKAYLPHASTSSREDVVSSDIAFMLNLKSATEVMPGRNLNSI